jgi:hypothetical protein
MYMYHNNNFMLDDIPPVRRYQVVPRNHSDMVYFRMSRYTGSPRTILVIWRKEPVRDMSRPPKEM